MDRRFRVMYGEHDGERGYVVTDSEDDSTGDWRGRVLMTTDSRGEAEAEAEIRNQEQDR
jgi:hypothetical protein